MYTPVPYDIERSDGKYEIFVKIERLKMVRSKKC